MSIAALGVSVVAAEQINCVGAHIFYDVAPGVKDGDVCSGHDQDFMTRNRTEDRAYGGVEGVADREDLPGG